VLYLAFHHTYIFVQQSNKVRYDIACPMTGAFADPIRETCLAPSPGNAFAVLAETLSA
jgi:hypothetical protein